MSEKKKDAVSVRKEKVNNLIKEMEESGYSLIDLSVDGSKANIMSLFTGLVPSLIFIGLFIILYGWEKFIQLKFDLMMICFIVSIVIHEGIHGLFFGIFAKNHFKSIEFGIVWKSLNPYCYCSEPVNKAQYMTALLMPGTILGVCTGIIALLIGNGTLVGFSALSFFAAGGDIYIAYLILKNAKKRKEEYYIDHPIKPGVLVLVKE